MKDLNENLPKPTEGAENVARLATGIATAFAALAFPPAALVGPLLDFAISRFIERPTQILLDELKSGNIQILTAEQAVQFMPMTYKFLEAAKEAEYEHNLKILAAYIANELKEEVPDAPAFARMARRLEGLTQTELKVIALIDLWLSTMSQASTDTPTEGSRPYVSATGLAKFPNNTDGLNRFDLQEALTELASRGLLKPDGATRTGKAEEYYFASQAFVDLIAHAKDTIEAAKND